MNQYLNTVGADEIWSGLLDGEDLAGVLTPDGVTWRLLPDRLAIDEPN